jgi:hypothetical protein
MVGKRWKNEQVQNHTRNCKHAQHGAFGDTDVFNCGQSLEPGTLTGQGGWMALGEQGGLMDLPYRDRAFLWT